MKRLRLAYLLACLALPTVGCLKRLRVEFYNDTGRPLIVAPADQETCRLATGTVCAFWYVRQVSVSDPERRWDFEVAGLGDLQSQAGIVESRGPFERVLRLRITDARVAYVVAPGGAWSTNLSVQPSGYPLQPLRDRRR